MWQNLEWDLPSLCWRRKGELFGEASLGGDTWEEDSRGGKEVKIYGMPGVLYENLISIFPVEGHSIPFIEEEQSSERLSLQAGNDRARTGSQISDLGPGLFPPRSGRPQTGERAPGRQTWGLFTMGRGEGTGKKSRRPGATQGTRWEPRNVPVSLGTLTLSLRLASLGADTGVGIGAFPWRAAPRLRMRE